MKDIISDFPDKGHNHRRCVKTALQTAEKLSQERGARLTNIRRQVLELVWESHEPVTAYDLLDRLKPEKPNATPPTVYRALEFLLSLGLVHRIESLNAFVGCGNPGNDHSGQFLICNRCGVVAELGCESIDREIDARAKSLGFSVERQTVEVGGVCSACR